MGFLMAGLVTAMAMPMLAQTQAEAKVDAAAKLHAIDRGIYGQFLEHFGRVIEHGLWAELLQNRKFYPSEALDQIHVAPPWSGDPNVKDVSYSVDRSVSMEQLPPHSATILELRLK